MIGIELTMWAVLAAIGLSAIQLGLMLTPTLGWRLFPRMPKASTPPVTLEIPDAADLHPFPIWQVNEFGNMIWANAAATQAGRQLFILAQAPLVTEPFEKQVKFEAEGEPTKWFDVTFIPSDHGGTYYTASADAEVSAKIAKREFVQTLSKTFGQLSTGLAIFDRQRTLVSFNPALLDLTGISFESLAARPHMLSFMDHLRDRGIIPEPKNYNAWRNSLGDLVSAAENDQFVDIWPMPSGQTIRVSGRPHPDGAIAFLFEDITQETALVRHYRGQVDQVNAALDHLNLGLALFGHDGSLLWTNSTYEAIWSHDVASATVNLSISDCARIWRIKSEPSELWTAGQTLTRSDPPVLDHITLQSGQVVEVEFTRLPNRITMATFKPQADRIELPELVRAQA